jgi:hypothetical protein
MVSSDLEFVLRPPLVATQAASPHGGKGEEGAEGEGCPCRSRGGQGGATTADRRWGARPVAQLTPTAADRWQGERAQGRLARRRLMRRWKGRRRLEGGRRRVPAAVRKGTMGAATVQAVAGAKEE